VLTFAETLAHMGSWELDLRTRLAFWSDGMYRINGIEPHEIEPSIEALLRLAHPDDRLRLAELLRRVIEYPDEIPATGVTIEYRIVRADGSVREIRALGRVEPDSGGQPAVWVGSAQDVTDERLTERELMAHYALSQTLSEWASFEEGVVALLRRLGAALDLPVGAVWAWDGDRQLLTARALWSGPDVDADAFVVAVRGCAFRPGRGLPGHAFKAGRPVVVEDLESDPISGHPSAAAAAGLRSGIAIPAIADGSPLAVLSFYGFYTRRATDRFQRTLTGLGHDLGRFLARRRAELAPGRLSAREAEIPALAAAGNSGPQIAAMLVVSPSTVKTHFENIYEKLGVGDRPAAVAYALRTGLFQ
jgi:PAS domain S-box-containing protein